MLPFQNYYLICHEAVSSKHGICDGVEVMTSKAYIKFLSAKMKLQIVIEVVTVAKNTYFQMW